MWDIEGDTDGLSSQTGLLPRTETMNARYLSPDGDPRRWKPGDLTAQGDTTHPSMVYAVQSPFTGELHYPSDGRHWGSEKRRMKSWLEAWGSKYIERDIKDGRPEALLIKDAPVPGDPKFRTNHPALTRARKEAERIRAAGCWPAAHWRDEGQGTFGMKKYLNDVKQGIVPTTYWSDDDYGEPFEIGDTSWDHHQSGHSQSGVNELSAIMGRGHEFDTVKPLRAACRRAWKASLRVRAASSRVSISLSASKPWVWSTHMSLMIPSSSPGHAMAIRSAMSSASMLVQACGFVPGNVFRSILTSN
jgi:hypothetical protein